MYEFAWHFREWNVKQDGGLIYRMEYDQFWEWMEFNRLSGSLQKEDYRSAQLLSKIHNVNTTKQEHLTTPKDFMLKTLDETIEEEIVKKKEEEEKENVDIDTHDASVHSFKSYVDNLKATHKPHKETIKG